MRLAREHKKWLYGLKHTKAKIMMMYTIVKMLFGIAHVQYVDGAPDNRVLNFQYCPICGVHMENANVDIVKTIDFAIDATDAKDEYSRGMRNGMRYAKSLIDGKDLVFEEFLEDLNG